MLISLVLAPRAAADIPVGESGDSSASALMLQGANFLNSRGKEGSDPTVFPVKRSTTATILGEIDQRGTDVDWYSFFACEGEQGFFDVEDATEPAIRDTSLALFDGAGTLLAYADDQFNTAQIPPDPGSSSGFHSFLGVFTFPADDLYFLAISAGPDSNGGILPDALGSEASRTPLVRPDGVIYGPNLFVANFSVEGATVGIDSYSGVRQCIASPSTCGNYRLHITLPFYSSKTLRPLHLGACRNWKPRW